MGSATAFPVGIEAINRTNDLKSPAKFELTVENSFDTEKTFKPSLLNTTKTWWFYEQNFKNLKAGEKDVFEVTVNASRESREGRNNFTIQVRTLEGEKSTVNEYFILKKPEKKSEKSENETTENETKTEEESTEKILKNAEIERTREENLVSKNLYITVKNPNQGPIEETVTRSVPFYLAPVTFNSPSPDSTKFVNEKKVMEWNLQIGPESEKKIRSSVNHLIFFGGVGLILLGLTAIKLTRKSIKIEKEVKWEGKLLKAVIHLKNPTKKTYENISVKDFIPSVLEYEESKAVKPTLTKTDNGTRLEWEIESLKPGENRKLIYTMKPKFEEKSDVHLPEAELTTRNGIIKESSKEETTIEPGES